MITYKQIFPTTFSYRRIIIFNKLLHVSFFEPDEVFVSELKMVKLFKLLKDELKSKFE